MVLRGLFSITLLLDLCTWSQRAQYNLNWYIDSFILYINLSIIIAMQTEVLTTFTILHEYGSQNGICLSVINAVELAHIIDVKLYWNSFWRFQV